MRYASEPSRLRVQNQRMTFMANPSAPGKRKQPPPRPLTVAAIMPLYNGELWVEQAIRSILSQTVAPDEIIVIDDGSTDGGAALVRALIEKHPQISLMSQPNAGQSAARNTAIAQCTSEWIALIDQDDLWYPNHIEDLIRVIHRHRGLRLGWVYSDFDDIDLDGRMVTRSFVSRMGVDNPKRELVRVLNQGFIIQPSATLINRAAILEVGGFDERLSGYEDDDLFLRIFLANFDNAFLDRPTSQWRIHQTSSGGTDRMEESLRIYSHKLLDAFPNDKWRGLYYRSRYIAPRFIRTWLQMYVRARRYKDRKKMRLYVREARSLVHYLRPRARLVMTIGLFFLPVVLAWRSGSGTDRSAVGRITRRAAGL
jgi:glycosyltransferase involved in cell wall biosynthesis